MMNQLGNVRFSRSTAAAVLACVMLFGSAVSEAAAVAQASYPSAAEASRALVEAVEGGNRETIRHVVGPEDELLNSRDDATEQDERAQFLQRYRQMHRLVKQSNGSMLLYIGAENWPFPVPLVQRAGLWSFDSAAGAKEVRFRRVGENELTAIEVCQALDDEQRRHTDPPQSVAPDSFYSAVLSTPRSGNQPVRYHGYEFRVLERSGDRAAIVAYPAEYRSSGVMTFVLDQDGAVYERDLGPRTVQLAKAMTRLQRDPRWVRSSLPEE